MIIRVRIPVDKQFGGKKAWVRILRIEARRTISKRG